MKQSTRAERLGARVLYEWGEMNIAEIARDTGRAQKTIHTWKRAEGWVHPDDQPEFGQWHDTRDVAEAGPPEHQIDRTQDPAVDTSEIPMDEPGPTEAAHQTADAALRAEVEALQAKNDALRAALIEAYKPT